MKSGEVEIQKQSTAPSKNSLDKDDTHMGVIYNMTEIEPAYYLAVSQLVLYKDLRQAATQTMKNQTN